MRRIRELLVLVAVIIFATAAQAQVRWDMSIAWPPGNFHTKNAVAFAEAVKARTAGRVVITVHAGGALGIKGPESLRAVRDGIVPIAEMFLSAQAGDVPLFSIETMPFMVRSPEELRTLYSIVQPRFEKVLASYNQKLLYIVPWPGQMIFTKAAAATVEDLKGIKIRTTDRNNSDMMAILGMSPVALPISDMIPALATGTVQGVQTSAPTAVDFKLWEFVKHALYTNHSWSSNMVTVNLDKWKALSAADQKAIEDLASEMQPAFWNVSIAADKEGQKTIAAQGITITQPTPAVLAQMEKLTRPIWDAFVKRVPQAKEPIDEYLAAVGRK